MTDKPISFMPSMIAALRREDGKRQTRRLVRSQPPRIVAGAAFVNGSWCWRRGDDGSLCGSFPVRYAVGDRLWVREQHFAWGHWERTGETTATGKPKKKFVRKCFSDSRLMPVLFEPGKTPLTKGMPENVFGLYQRPAMFMFRADSRSTLMVTDVKVEPLQDISGDDCIAEGVIEVEEIVEMTSSPSGHPVEVWGNRFRVYGIGDDDEGFETEHECMSNLWDTVNGAGSWDRNEWVEAYTFEFQDDNIDKMRLGV